MVKLKRIAAFVVACGLVAWIHALLKHHELEREWRLAFHWEPDRVLQYPELLHYLALLFFGVPAAVLLALSLPSSLFQRVTSALERAGLWLPAAWSALAACALSQWVTQGAWYTDDEQAYLFQAKCYLSGVLAVPALPYEGLFHHPFVVVSQIKEGMMWWAGTYPIMQPLMMALSMLVGSPLISNWLCAGAIAYHSGRLAETLTGERRMGVCAAWLCGASPMLIGLSSTYHTSVLGCALSLFSVRALLAARDNPTFGRGLLTGALAGATFLTRGLEGALMVGATGLALIWSLRRQLRPLLLSVLGFGVAGMLALQVYYLVNYATTGDILDTTYGVWARQYGRIMGFGEGLMWGRKHSVLHALSQTFTSLVRINVWAFGWPLSLFVALLGLVAPLRTRGTAWLLTLCAAQLFGYFFLAWGSVHDFGSAYHVWHVPYLAAVSAVVAQRARSFGVDAPRFLLGLILVGLVSFWPSQIQKWYHTAEGTLGPIRAAEAVAKGREAIVLWSHLHMRDVNSWVHNPPAPFPSDHVLWARDTPPAEQLLRQIFPKRVFVRVQLTPENRWSAVELPAP